MDLDSLTKALSHNLRRHARGYESISALCRACGVNRQQFNKYLAGETLPSLLNLVKISNTLNVGVDDLLRLQTGRPEGARNPVVELKRVLEKEKAEIRTGYYLDYTYSSVFRGSLLVGVCKIEKKINIYKCTVKLMFRNREHGSRTYFKYSGRAYPSREAVYLNYAHERDPKDFIYCIMQPDVRYSADLIGIRTGMSNSIPSIPFSASFYLRYMGERPDLRAALRQCGLYPLDSLDDQQSQIMARLDAKTQSAKNILRIGHV